MLTYMLMILLAVNPFAFGYRRATDGDIIILVVFLSSFVIPLVSVAVSYLLGWIQSIQMPTREERIAPLLISVVMYVSLYLHVSRANVFPMAFRVCVLGVVIALFLAFFLTIVTKVSLHGVGAGGLVSMVILTVLYFSYDHFDLVLPGLGAFSFDKEFLLYGSILLAGLICSARLILKAHKVQDVYGGFIAGFFSQLIAFIILQ